MVNYQQGKIYKIVCNTTGKDYIGSTCEQRLSQRLTKHVATYKQYLKGNKTYCSSYDLIEKGNYEIILLETYPCNSSEELRMRERFYKDNTECVNINSPISTKEDRRESSLNYYYENKEKVQKYKRIYNEKNEEKIRERGKDYYEENKQKIKGYQSVYRAENREKECARVKRYLDNNVEKVKEKRHQKYLNQKDAILERNKIKRLYLNQLKYYNI